MNIVCVLTGDLVDSQNRQTTEYIKALQVLLDDLKQDGKLLLGNMHRGDEFQAVAASGWGMLCALYIRAGLKAQNADWDARISVGYGSATEEDGTYGTAYLYSGKGLDGIRGNERLQLWANGRFYPELAAAIDFIIDGWSESIAGVVKNRIFSKTNKRVAEELDVSAVYISTALKRAGYDVLLGLIHYIKELGGENEHSAS